MKFDFKAGQYVGTYIQTLLYLFIHNILYIYRVCRVLYSVI